jgi:hypothetical protein
MTFDEFNEKIEERKEVAYNRAWFILLQTLEEKPRGVDTPSREQIDVAKYIINRKDGMPTQKIGGDEKNPIVTKIEITIKK